MEKEFLPVGSVVLLKGGTKRVMVTGFCSVDNDDTTKIYDYTGCLYPEGDGQKMAGAEQTAGTASRHAGRGKTGFTGEGCHV